MPRRKRESPTADQLLTPAVFCRDVIPMSPSSFRSYCARFGTLIDGLVPYGSRPDQSQPRYRLRMSAVIRHLEEDLGRGHWRERNPKPFPFDARRGGFLRRGSKLVRQKATVC